MSEFLLRNSLNPNKVVQCTISFRQLVAKGDEGEPVWLVEIGTLEPHKTTASGYKNIDPVFIHYTSSINLDAAIKEATETIAAQVDWEPLDEDLRPPFVSYSSPIDGEVVGIYSDVIIDIKDVLPAAGIDIDSITMSVNGFDVTSEIDIDGDPYEYRIRWVPFKRVLDTYL
jgi:hypothetical protein